MAATSTSDVAATTASSGSTTDGPVLNLINKRLRALRKKYNRIVQMEEFLVQGKTLNSEQQELLRSKSSVLCLIDELEKLRSPLSSAVSEEVSFALSQHQDPPLQPLNRAPEECEMATAEEEEGKRDVVEDLLNLLYFGSLFDVMHQSEFTSLMLTRTHERGCCLTYDYVTDDAIDLLGERDLDVISALKGLLISRPVDSSLSHKDALRQCIEHAKLWIAKSDRPIHPGSDVTYAGLREKLHKIMSSDYYTTTPDIKAAVEMAVAAAAGNFGSFQVPVHGSMIPDSLPVQVVEQYQEMDENIADFKDFETVEDQSVPVDPLQPKDNLETTEKPSEGSPNQTDQVNQHANMEENPRDVGQEEQQHAPSPRRTYQNQRGGRVGGNGRRSYPNSRGGRGGRGGGGPYQNGRNQYYDQSGNYYPRNYNNRGRGGRGTGGSNYYYHGSTANGGHAQEDVGVAS
ncbi:hypothetical protein Dimus_014982 [Dionaea muscipula]